MKFNLSTIRISAMTLSLALSSATSFADSSEARVKSVVLVHGAWADGSSWSKVIPILQAKGLNVVAVHNPLTSIADDVAATNRIIDAQEGRVMLVGHSYGGAVISEAGNNPKVAGLVYIAAFAPDEGETLGGLVKEYPTPPLLSNLKPIGDGYLLLTSTGVTQDFAPDLTKSEKNLVLATQAPIPGTLFNTPSKKAAWHEKPSWYIVASKDRAISPELEYGTAKRINAATLTLPTGHVVMLAAPDKVASFVVQAIAQVSK